MTSKEKEDIREQVKTELISLERSISTITELLTAEVQSDANDWFTTKESDPSREINELAIEKAARRVLILKDVLKRIDSTGFGICTRCGKPIPVKRMKAVPTATRCVSCS